MTDETQSSPSVYDQVFAELGSSYERSGYGPMKDVNGMTVGKAVFDPERDVIEISITISADHRSPWGDTGSDERSFTVPLEDIRKLGETAPKFSFQFKRAAEELGPKLEAERARYLKEKEEKWLAAGVPIDQPVTAMKQLRLKPGPGTGA